MVLFAYAVNYANYLSVCLSVYLSGNGLNGSAEHHAGGCERLQCCCHWFCPPWKSSAPACELYASGGVLLVAAINVPQPACLISVDIWQIICCLCPVWKTGWRDWYGGGEEVDWRQFCRLPQLRRLGQGLMSFLFQQPSLRSCHGPAVQAMNLAHSGFAVLPLTSTWPHLRCDVGLDEGEY